MGQVHAARHKSGRNVVVKRLRNTLASDLLLAKSLGDEGRVLRRVRHSNVVNLVDQGTTADGAPFLVMDRARGTTLSDLVKKGPIGLRRVRDIVVQIFDGLTAIHDAGIVHADIKSDNIIVDTIDGTDHVTIIDFGLARTRTSQSLPESEFVAGTPDYMAPEIIRGGRPSIAGDIYATGVVIFEMLVGHTPFHDCPPMQVLERQLSDAIVFPEGAPVAHTLERVVLRAVEKKAEQRYSNVRAFASAVTRAITEIVGISPTASFDEQIPTKTRQAAVTVTDIPVFEAEDESEAVRARRAEVQVAFDLDSPDPVIVAYLALADTMIAEGRLHSAVDELESAIVLLQPRTGKPPRSLWRISLLLAAMYERVGNKIRARRAAMDANELAARSGDTTGRERTEALLKRLNGRALAHGTDRGFEPLDRPTTRVEKTPAKPTARVVTRDKLTNRVKR
jgi:serine/threonine protein kinase